MDRKEVLSTLQELMADIIDDESVTLTESTTAKDVDGWDSLTHITFITAIEEEFDIKFTMKDVTGMQDVGDLLAVIERELE